MAQVTGKNAIADFGGTAYACLTDLTIDGTANTVSTECSTDGTGAATTNRAAGAEAWTVTTTLLLDGASVVVPTALDTSTSGALKAYPAGDAVADIEYSWTTAYVDTHSVASATSDHLKLNITWLCDGSPAIATKAP